MRLKQQLETATQNRQASGSARWLEVVRGLVNSLNYGVVQIVVHDSTVVKIERTEKVRLNQK